jgi:DNA-binding LytR/AlgR family response regulator
MIRIAIVEDMAPERSRMKEYVEQYFAGKNMEYELFLFTDGRYLLEQYPKQLDLILLDIEMEQLDGLKTAHQIREFDEKVQIFFVTAMIQYALEGYSVDAADFIVKPIRYPVFCSRMDRIMKKIQAARPHLIAIRQGKEEILCPAQQIICIESNNKKTVIHREGEAEILSTEPLYTLEKRLEQEPFFRCHNAFLVNLKYIQTVTSTEVTVHGMRVPVSKHRKKEFMQALTNYRGRML